MSWRDPIVRPADRSPASWVFDVLVTLFSATSAGPYLFHDQAQPGPAAILALAAVVLPLVVRNLWPVPVFAWMLALDAVVVIADLRVVPFFGLLVAVYTVAASQSRRTVGTCVGLLELAALAVALDFPGAGWFFDAIFVTGMIGAATAVGLYAATRRAYLLELHDRAERLEREKEQTGELAAAAERARIAREMHDIVAHHLTVMVALSDGAIAASAQSPERGVEVMRTVSATGRTALADTRRLLGVLRSDGDDPPVRQPLPDLGELDDLIERVRATGLPTTFEVDGLPAELPAGLQLTVFRLVQEALTNTMKHGGPGAHAAVRLHHRPDEVQIEVEDDGAGAHAPVPAGPGSGLAGMRERVHVFGGDLQSGPRRGGGWRVAAQLRLDAGEDTG